MFELKNYPNDEVNSLQEKVCTHYAICYIYIYTPSGGTRIVLKTDCWSFNI